MLVTLPVIVQCMRYYVILLLLRWNGNLMHYKLYKDMTYVAFVLMRRKCYELLKQVVQLSARKCHA